MAPIAVAAVGSIASDHGYEEIQYNEKSRVISFRKHNDRGSDSVRINVYYTTGTVATCINHPFKGKTQLFRRDRTLQDLNEIFSNPRTHTGAGYYLTNQTVAAAGNGGTRPVWTSTTGTGGNAGGKTESDDSQRWRYVQAATGFCNLQQASQIAAACELWNKLRFAQDGGQTVHQLWQSWPLEAQTQSSYSCTCGKCGQDRAGSFCALGRILCFVAHKTDPEAIMPALVYTDQDKDEDASRHESDDASPKPLNVAPMQGIVECTCAEGVEFKELHCHELDKFQKQLMSFPKPIRRELIYFFFKKMMHSYDLVVKQEGDGGADYNLYGGAYLSNIIMAAHGDYGEITYGDDDSEEFGGHWCFCHGSC